MSVKMEIIAYLHQLKASVLVNNEKLYYAFFVSQPTQKRIYPEC